MRSGREDTPARVLARLRSERARIRHAMARAVDMNESLQHARRLDQLNREIDTIERRERDRCG